MFVLFPGSVWSTDFLEGGVTNYSKVSRDGTFTFFPSRRRPNNQTNMIIVTNLYIKIMVEMLRARTLLSTLCCPTEFPNELGNRKKGAKM